MRRILAAMALVLIGLPASAATVSITASEQGNDVVLVGSGSIDLTGGNYVFAFDSDGLETNNQQFFIGGTGLTDVYQWGSSTGTTLSSLNFNFIATGDTFGFDRFNALGLTAGYVSGSAIDFVWTVTGRTLADLGLSFGTIATIGNNTITLQDGSPSEVPLPASAFLLLGAMGGIGLMKRKKPAAA